ncbi:MAG: hypothetical protein GC180_11725 [Bacteroidetes bacterium]|nr:hypothetical protein [Bacteroidota bacterium]
MKNQLPKMIRWDFVLLQRNNLILLAILVAAAYLGLFKLLTPLGDLRGLLILLVFNDPVVTGLLFAGVIVLFEKNQQTLKALEISATLLKIFLLSKTLALATLSTASALLLNLAAIGIHFQWIHFTLGTFLISVFFILVGFHFGNQSRDFTHFITKIFGFLMLSALPFLAIYGLVPEIYFYWLPPFAGLKLIQASYFDVSWPYLIYAYGFLIAANVLTWKFLIKNFKTQYA